MNNLIINLVMEDDQRIAPETDVYNSDSEVDKKTRHKLKNEVYCIYYIFYKNNCSYQF